jgi:hypothetical protein
MDIYAFKRQFEERVRPAPLEALVSAEQAWSYFKESLPETVADEACEEAGFSVSLASYFQGHQLIVDENLFQIYFGRLIDARKASSWQTAEINFYYRYEINRQLTALLASLPRQDFEIARCASDEKNLSRQKIETLAAFGDEKRAIWEAVRALKPALADFHFWIQ